ncbi:MAG: phage holin family protein [Tatlockia sp.]|jgi:hypothetical protein
MTTETHPVTDTTSKQSGLTEPDARVAESKPHIVQAKKLHKLDSIHALYAGLTELCIRAVESKPHVVLAKKLHKSNKVYSVYAGLDGLSLSSSMFFYATELYLNDLSLSTADAVHDWMVTPAGLIAAASGSVALIAFSVLATQFSDDDANAFKRYTAILWPYARDALKALKNSYKGWRSQVLLMTRLGVENLNPLIVPVGVLLGGIALLNRLIFRWMLEERKVMMTVNAKLLSTIKSTKYTWETIYKIAKTQNQSTEKRFLSLLCQVVAGSIDSLYLYVGILGLSAVMPPLLVIMSAVTSVYVVAHIATRLYEEYDYQRKLDIAIVKVDLATGFKKIDWAYTELHKISLEIASGNPLLDYKSLQRRQTNFNYLFELETKRFMANYKTLHSLSTLHFTSAFLAGAKNGIAAYGALASVLLGIATILALTSTAFPAALLVTSVFFGLALLTGFIAFSLVSAYRYWKKEVKAQKIDDALSSEKDSLSKIEELLANVKSKSKKLEPEAVRKTIEDGMVVDSSSQLPFQEWFEVILEMIRSGWSGIRQGVKAISLLLNPFEQADELGHYHETHFMLALMVVSAVVHSIVFALRAFCRGFGRQPIDAVESKETELTDSTEAAASPAKACEPVLEDRKPPPPSSFSHKSSKNSFYAVKVSNSNKQPEQEKSNYVAKRNVLSPLVRTNSSGSAPSIERTPAVGRTIPSLM